MPSCFTWNQFFLIVLSLSWHGIAISDSPSKNTNVATESHSGADSGANACYNFGCPFLPRDVFYDEDAKTALHRLKEPKRKLHKHLDDPNSDDNSEEGNDSSKATTGRFLSELDSSGDRHRSTMTLCGYKGGDISAQINQDRSILVSPFLEHYQLLGVLDGHGNGGELVSEHARIEIPKLLSTKLDELMTNEKTMTSDDTVTLMELDDKMVEKISQILKDVFVEVEKSAFNNSAARQGGCTASVALQLGSKLFLANAGDSQTILAAHLGWNETTQIVYATREDKPDLPDERERVEQAGGIVQLPESYDDGDSARVVFRDPASGMAVGLAMSRSIGDWDAPGVITEPIVDVLDLREVLQTVIAQKDEFDCDAANIECGPPEVNFFIVSATDGLLDFVKRDNIVEKIGVTFFGRQDVQHVQTGKGSSHVHLAVEQLIFHAARSWHDAMQGQYRDDITISTSKVFPWES